MNKIEMQRFEFLKKVCAAKYGAASIVNKDLKQLERSVGEDQAAQCRYYFPDEYTGW